MLEAHKCLSECHIQIIDKKDYSRALECAEGLMKAALALSVDIELRMQGARK
jgi:hypothetical protein